VIFAIETGCRRGELLSLEWKDVDLFDKVVTILATKTGEKRTIPLTERAFEVLTAKRKGRAEGTTNGGLVFTNSVGGKINFRTLRSSFDAALVKAGGTNFRFHDLRHTFATRLARSGVDPYTIQKLMGHTSFTTTQRYAHHFVESLRRGIKHLDVSRNERQAQNLSQI
jgi:integrase